MDKNEGMINILAENYPQLRASENFSQFQVAIADCEEHLQASRRCFNNAVSTINQMIVTFPQSVVANMKHLTKKDFLKVDEESKKDVVVDF